MESPRSLRTRALMALLLMVGFYGFALAIAGMLAWVPYAEYRYLHRVDARIAFFCLAGAVTIVWSLLPRLDKFSPPGPQLTPSTAPDLFKMINEVAGATSQPRPEEVYLLSDVNAFVTQRGGMMGFGSRRVMGIGLPLIKGLSPSQLRSVVAHEFGHYVSGDVALGPWIYKTRAAIGRTIDGLKNNRLLSGVFNGYARMFMRITMQVSREQEFVADATAARVAGADETISALRRVEIMAPAYATYMNHEVMPVLRAGYLPPVSSGFDDYISDADTVQRIRDYVHGASADAAIGEYDTHPPMKDRVAALESLRPHRRLGDTATPLDLPTSSTSATLLHDPDRHARALLEFNFGRDAVVKLKAIAWTDVGSKVYTALWHQQVKDCAGTIGALTADQIPSSRSWFVAKGHEFAKGNSGGDPEFSAAFAIHVVTCAIGLALLQHGWVMETAVGKPITFSKNGERMNPRDFVVKLADGSLKADTWKTECDRLNITGVPLQGAAHVAAPSH